MTERNKIIWIVPCFNEENRIDLQQWERLVNDSAVHILFVNDGSKDGTKKLIKNFCNGVGRETKLNFLDLEFNQGKAEAVRRGLCWAIEKKYEYVAYADADLATPVNELIRLSEFIMKEKDVQVVMASRVALLGYHIERKMWRHYLGRVFATVASIVLNEVVYDTQCGAKIFRVNDTLMNVLDMPFKTNWTFDVELLGRLLGKDPEIPDLLQRPRILEVPLQHWCDKPGSKLNLKGMYKAFMQLLWLGCYFRRN